MDKGLHKQTYSAQLIAIGLAAIAPVCAAMGWDLVATALGVALVTVLVVLRRPGTASGEEDGTEQALRVHLSRARRRDEPADLLVVRTREEAAVVARGLKDALRVTDSAYLTRVEGCWELHAVVDRHRLDRDALQARLSLVAGNELEVGWAGFPEHGFTLGALAAHARAATETAPLHAPRPAAQVTELFPPLAAAQAQGAVK